MSNPANTAMQLHKLDVAMRNEAPRALAIAARVRFYEAAVMHYALHRLPSLARMVSNTRLSQQSIDLVFEDARYSFAVKVALARLCNERPAFRAALADQLGTATVALWLGQASTTLAA